MASSTGTKPSPGLVDQGTILLLVCNAFGAAVVGGIWRDRPLSALLSTPIACALLPALAITTLTWIARRLGFSREEEIASAFRDSRKSLSSGLRMARALLAGVPGSPGTPLLSLMACTVVARRHVDRGVRRAGDDSHEAD